MIYVKKTWENKKKNIPVSMISMHKQHIKLNVIMNYVKKISWQNVNKNMPVVITEAS
jgi:hypothetical protein